jgi:hypothetical protein
MCNVFDLDPCSRSGYLRRECQVCGIEVVEGEEEEHEVKGKKDGYIK